MGKIKKTKKIKKEKKVKLTAQEIRLKEQHNNFISILKTTLNINEGGFYLSFINSPSKSNEEKVIDAILKLKEDFAREDEGTKLEAENKRNLMEIIQMITKDEVRIVEINNNKEIELAKLKHSNCD